MLWGLREMMQITKKILSAARTLAASAA